MSSACSPRCSATGGDHCTACLTARLSDLLEEVSCATIVPQLELLPMPSEAGGQRGLIGWALMRGGAACLEETLVHLKRARETAARYRQLVAAMYDAKAAPNLRPRQSTRRPKSRAGLRPRKFGLRA